VSLRVPLNDLPTTPQVKEGMDRAVRLGLQRPDDEEDLKLQHYFGGWEVGLLPDEPGGPVIVALVRPFQRARGWGDAGAGSSQSPAPTPAGPTFSGGRWDEAGGTGAFIGASGEEGL
jgi:hypothetical protein